MSNPSWDGDWQSRCIELEARVAELEAERDELQAEVNRLQNAYEPQDEHDK